MLWWFIGVWLASGAVLPVCWLLSMAYRAAAKRIGPKGLYVLSGLVSIGALILYSCPQTAIQTSQCATCLRPLPSPKRR